MIGVSFRKDGAGINKLCVILEKHEIDNEQKIENDLHTTIVDLKLFLC